MSTPRLPLGHCCGIEHPTAVFETAKSLEKFLCFYCGKILDRDRRSALIFRTPWFKPGLDRRKAHNNVVCSERNLPIASRTPKQNFVLHPDGDERLFPTRWLPNWRESIFFKLSSMGCCHVERVHRLQRVLLVSRRVLSGGMSSVSVSVISAGCGTHVPSGCCMVASAWVAAVLYRPFSGYSVYLLKS